MSKEYRAISLQTKLVVEVQDFVKDRGTYPSVAAFVSEAVRLRLEELKKVC